MIVRWDLEAGVKRGGGGARTVAIVYDHTLTPARPAPPEAIQPLLKAIW